MRIGTWREDAVAAANNKNHDEFYTYDGLNRLKDAQRGNLTGTFPDYTGITSKNFAQDWTLDQLGNWPTFKQDNDGNGTWDLEQQRSHNEVNELTEFTTTNWADPAYDAAGNMTTSPQPLAPSSSYTLKYDAWNRLVEVKDGANVVQQNEYDGLGERIVRVDMAANPDVAYDCYYNDRWQLLEEHKEVSGTEDPHPLASYVWHPYYIDALAVRYWDGNVDGDYVDTNEGAHYYLQDANFNVTAVADVGGGVIERYSYTPYGEVTVLNPDFSPHAGGASAIGNTHLYTGRERDPEGEKGTFYFSENQNVPFSCPRTTPGKMAIARSDWIRRWSVESLRVRPEQPTGGAGSKWRETDLLHLPLQS